MIGVENMIGGVHYKVKALTVDTINGQYRFSDVEISKREDCLFVDREIDHISFPLQNIIYYQ